MSNLPTTFSRYTLAQGKGFDGLSRIDEPLQQPKRKEVLVRVHAVSLQFRDLAIAKGLYPAELKDNLIPCSDGAGEVVAVGEDVTKFAVGDRVIANFTQDQIAGPHNDTAYFEGSLGGQAHGMLSEYRNLPDHGLVKFPQHLSFEEAATLPCAALTAWNALFGAEGKSLRPGQTALLQGTGGVSVFGAQFALLAGARVIITSSSDAKLETVLSHLSEQAGSKALKRVFTINYKKEDWAKRALEITGGVGVDHILEVGGAGTIAKSFEAVRQGGTISAIGVLSDGTASSDRPNIGAQALYKAATLRGILIGSRKQLEDLVSAFAQSELRPLITKSFAFDEAKEAYEFQWGQNVVGKVVVRVV